MRRGLFGIFFSSLLLGFSGALMRGPVLAAVGAGAFLVGMAAFFLKTTVRRHAQPTPGDAALPRAP